MIIRQNKTVIFSSRLFGTLTVTRPTSDPVDGVSLSAEALAASRPTHFSAGVKKGIGAAAGAVFGLAMASSIGLGGLGHAVVAGAGALAGSKFGGLLARIDQLA